MRGNYLCQLVVTDVACLSFKFSNDRMSQCLAKGVYSRTGTFVRTCFFLKVQTCSNHGPNLVEPVLQFRFTVLHQMSSQVQVQFEVLSQRWENRTELNFGNPNPDDAYLNEFS
jgi:hypothetical protein